MFGKNKTFKIQKDDNPEMPVKEIFATIQGEGPYSGQRAIFIRLGRCSLKCHYCFIGSTLITMGDGKKKRIDQVAEGEMVVSYNQSTESFEPKKVKTVMKSNPEKLLRLDFSENTERSSNPTEHLTCTPDHPLLVKNKGWVKAKDLEKGDVVLHYTNSDRMKMFNPAVKGRIMSEEQKKVMSDSMKRTWEKGNLRAIVKERMTNRNPMKNPEVAIKGFLNRKDRGKKSRSEMLFEEVFSEFPVTFVGDGSLILNNKVPDFLVNGQKKVIEVWDRTAPYTKDRGEDYIRERTEHFKKEGYETLCLALPSHFPKRTINPEFESIRKAIFEFIHNGDVFQGADVIKRGGKSWTALAGGKFDPITTYNLEVEDNHNYVANGKIVHNCDTDFESDLVKMTASQIVKKAKSLSGGIELAVITGGEPLLWKGTADLCQGLFDEGYLVQVETSGSVVQENFLHVVGKAWVDVVCSPKTPKIAKGLIGLVDCFKYVIKAGEVAEDGLPNMSTQIEGKESEIFRPDPLASKKIYVSPCDEHDPVKNAANIAECVRSVMKHGYTLSLQTHKVIGMP